MKVDTKSALFKETTIKDIEKRYNAKYVLEACIRMKDGSWGNFPAAIFYTDYPHPTGSNYFAMYYQMNGGMSASLMVADGISAVKDVVYAGLEAENEVVYSRYRHDYREHKNGAFIDGGRDYVRMGGDAFDDYNQVLFKIVDGEIVFVDLVPETV